MTQFSSQQKKKGIVTANEAVANGEENVAVSKPSSDGTWKMVHEIVQVESYGE